MRVSTFQVGASRSYLERNVYQGSRIEKRRSFSIDVFLITILLAMVVGIRGTIIGLRLFAQGPERVSRPRGERRVYIAPKSLDRDERGSIHYICLLEEARPF
jgi:hypothetical protein